MDIRLLDHYNRELGHLREVGAEFAAEFPKIAARLGMKGSETVLDPYVERLLEGTAFLASRVQLRLDAEFPKFTQHLLEMLYPQYLAPTPSMLIVECRPTLGDANLASGSILPRGTALRHGTGRANSSNCEFRTAADLQLLPLEIVDARYFSFASDIPMSDLPLPERCRGGVRLKLRLTAGLKCSQIRLDRLQFFLGGANEVALRLHELIGSSLIGIALGSGNPELKRWRWLSREHAALTGFNDEDALLPISARHFGGNRLLQEYFSFPSRFLFFEITGLLPLLSCEAVNEFELVLLFKSNDSSLEQTVDKSNFLLHCVPAINLFERPIDRVAVNSNASEYHVLADRTRPIDFEIYDLVEVLGIGSGQRSDQRFSPLYTTIHAKGSNSDGYYTLRREPRLLTEQQRKGRKLTGYVGSEVFLSLVDPNEAPFSHNLRQLSIRARCTNRDLPMLMSLDTSASHFLLEVAAPVEMIRCVKGPSKPCPALAQDAIAWQFISLLSLNYLSLLDVDPDEGAAALRQLLSLHSKTADIGIRKHIEGVRSVRCEPVVSRLPILGPLCFGRGVGITIEMDELAFEGGSAFLLASVLERFFARHVSLNSFTETSLRTLTRGDLMHWGPRCGTRPII